MTTTDAIRVLRQYLADKPKLAPRLRDALEQVLGAVDEAERVIGPLADEAAAIVTFADNAQLFSVPIAHLRAAAEWKRKHERSGK